MCRAVTRCSSGHWCADGSIVSPISICFAAISDKGSPYTSFTSFSSMKLGAKQIVQSMESTRDRVAVMAFPCAMPNNVYTLDASGY